MRTCLSCGITSNSNTCVCPSCGYTPPVIEGFPAYAPELLEGGANFPVEGFAFLAEVERGNFWFEARNRLIVHMLQRYAPDMTSYLEIGCGTGFVLQAVAEAFPHASLSGAEVFCQGLRYARQRVPAARLFQMDARQIPFREEFDVIGAFDVLEHIAEDSDVLAQVHAALQPTGLAVLTVPQHMWLWSTQDEAACHVRRYARGELEGKLAAAGFRVLETTSFVSLLLPMMWFSRKVKGDSSNELRMPPWLNKVLKAVMTLERAMIKTGMIFAGGGSRLIVAQKT